MRSAFPADWGGDVLSMTETRMLWALHHVPQALCKCAKCSNGRYEDWVASNYALFALLRWRLWLMNV